jgi:cell envelope opacity-associated protein A
LLVRAKIAATLSTDDIITRVRDTANWTGGAQQSRYQIAGVQQPLSTNTMSYAPADREADPYAGFEARIVPENITLLPKTANQTTGGNTWSERAVTVKKGDTIATILREIGATPDEIKAIAAALGTRGRDGGLKEGQRLRILLSTGRVSSRCA